MNEGKEFVLWFYCEDSESSTQSRALRFKASRLFSQSKLVSSPIDEELAFAFCFLSLLVNGSTRILPLLLMMRSNLQQFNPLAAFTKHIEIRFTHLE